MICNTTPHHPFYIHPLSPLLSERSRTVLKTDHRAAVISPGETKMLDVLAPRKGAKNQLACVAGARVQVFGNTVS